MGAIYWECKRVNERLADALFVMFEMGCVDDIEPETPSYLPKKLHVPSLNK